MGEGSSFKEDLGPGVRRGGQEEQEREEHKENLILRTGSESEDECKRVCPREECGRT